MLRWILCLLSLMKGEPDPYGVGEGETDPGDAHQPG